MEPVTAGLSHSLTAGGWLLDTGLGCSTISYVGFKHGYKGTNPGNTSYSHCYNLFAKLAEHPSTLIGERTADPKLLGACLEVLLTPAPKQISSAVSTFLQRTLMQTGL